MPVGFIWYFEGNSIFDYSFKNFSSLNYIGDHDKKVLTITLLTLLSTLLMFIGFELGRRVRFSINYSLGFLVTNSRITVKILFVFFCWLFVVSYILLFNGLPWYFVFFPAYADKPIYINYVLRTLYLYLPILCLFLTAIRDDFSKKQFFLMAIFVFFVAFSTGQRRDLLFALLFYFSLYMKLNYDTVSLKKILSYKFAFLAFISSFGLIVALWAARVVATNYLVKGELVYPFETRSFIDVIFGSGATGLPTLYTINDYVQNEDVDYFYNIYYGVTQVVPRFFWDHKLVGIDTIIQSHFFLDESPSVFWFGDLLFSSGQFFFPFVSFFLGFYLTLLQNFLTSLRSKYGTLLFLFLFSNFFTLFKNGFGTYLAISFSALFVISFFLLFLKIFDLRLLR